MHAAPSTAPAACENCATPLHGHYCHACGQHAVNPMRHFAHAVEDVFESFWHLDGRVFRTLRDLFVPGRVACNYLAGQRVRYIPPLRLFVILTVITFFVGQFAAAVGTQEARPAGSVVRVGADGSTPASFQRARTEAEVDALAKRQLAELATAREAAKSVPFAAAGIAQAEAEVRQQAAQRIAALRAAQPRTPATPAVAGTAPRPVPPKPAPDAAQAPEDAARTELQQLAKAIGTLRDPTAPWHERDNPVDVRVVPAFAEGWFNHRLSNMQRNVERVKREGESTILKLALAAVPSALFVLVPLFALLLRLLYLLTPRGYLEHLVVALYSHAAMLLVMLATFALILLRAATGAGAVATVSYILQSGLWLALPVYLFVMQRRVYGQHWVATAAKYVVLGVAYLMLVMMVVVYSVLAGLTSGA